MSIPCANSSVVESPEQTLADSLFFRGPMSCVQKLTLARLNFSRIAGLALPLARASMSRWDKDSLSKQSLYSTPRKSNSALISDTRIFPGSISSSSWSSSMLSSPAPPSTEKEQSNLQVDGNRYRCLFTPFPT